MTNRISREEERYEHGHDRPLRGYLAAAATYAAGVGSLVAWGLLTGHRPPARIEITDVVLGDIATHKFLASSPRTL